jgi:hypothetical protein
MVPSDREAFVMRRPSHATVVAYLALFVALGGTAAAATGGTFVLGGANAESTEASLSNSTGTPLALNAPSGHAPLAVNRTVQVNNLNAQYLGGRTATQLGVRRMFSFGASHQYPRVGGLTWRFVSDAPLLAFTDKRLAALVTGTVTFAPTDGNSADGYLSVCYETGGGTLTHVGSVLVVFNNMDVPTTVSAVVTNLVGNYYVGLCASQETANVYHNTVAGTVLFAEAH